MFYRKNSLIHIYHETNPFVKILADEPKDSNVNVSIQETFLLINIVLQSFQ